jgi:ubiquinone/menaquinone biosynthesis C-methylase UbiE
VDGVLDLLPGPAPARKAGQILMESPRVVGLYESRWWRASRLVEWSFGISLEDEMALVMRISRPAPADTVLDLACGPGLYARRFAEGGPGREVIGLDISWPMLKYASAKARSRGIQNLTFLRGDAHDLPLVPASVDVVSCCGALHLFPDFRRVLGELGRVIKPQGRLAAAVFQVPEWDPLSGLRRRHDRWAGLHRFGRSEIEELLDEAGFEPAVYHARRNWMVAGGVRRA